MSIPQFMLHRLHLHLVFKQTLVQLRTKKLIAPARIFCAAALLLLLSLTSCGEQPSSQNYFPATGKEALYQTALDLQGGAQVLSLALRPGEEDLSTLAYLRLGRGANITSAYWSNGEASASDLPEEYPHHLAARRRNEAVAALTYLGGETYFLNFPDVIAARDSLKLRRIWAHDSVQARLAQLILKIKPDLILIARDRQFPESSWQYKTMLAEVLSAAQNLAPGAAKTNGAAASGERSWQTSRVMIETARGKNAALVPVEEKHPKWKKRYRTIGEEAAAFYQSYQPQRARARETWQYSYKPVYPANAALKTLDENLAANLERSAIAETKWRLSRFAADLLAGNTNAAAQRLAVLADSVSYYIERRGLLRTAEVKSIYHWKGTLDKLQCLLLGVTVDYELSDSALTAVQVSFLTIKNITGLPEKGETYLFFGALPEGWIVNEGFGRRFPYKPGERYSLLSPQNLDLNAPAGLHGLNGAKATRTITFHVIHRGLDAENSFIYRLDARMAYAPRFVVEALTPIVRMSPGERVEVRLKNFSRDGVSDTVRVRHEWASSSDFVFRLSQKEAEQQAALYLDWNDNLAEGTYRLPIQIASDTVAWFAARKFEANVAREKRVGVLSGVAPSPLVEALRRLGVRARLVDLAKNPAQQIDSLEVLLVDRRALLLAPQIAKLREAIAGVAERGGHAIILAQEAESWNAAPLWEGLRLTATPHYDEEYPVGISARHALLTAPNALAEETWSNWLFARAENVIELTQREGVETPLLAAETDAPLLITKKIGSGKMTYVDLALTPQLMNIHPGAFRLLANLVSY